MRPSWRGELQAAAGGKLDSLRYRPALGQVMDGRQHAGRGAGAAEKGEGGHGLGAAIVLALWINLQRKHLFAD